MVCAVSYEELISKKGGPIEKSHADPYSEIKTITKGHRLFNHFG